MAAKSVLSSTIAAMKCPPTDLYQSLTDHCQRLWQVEWDGCLSNKLHCIKPTLGYVSYSHLGRRDAVTLRRLRMAIIDSLIRISLIEKTNHDVLIATVH